MKIAVHGTILALLTVLQTTWLEAFTVFGVKPNLFIIYIVVVCCFCSMKEGAILGFFFGLVPDLMAGGVIGLGALLSMLLGYSTAFFCEKTIRKSSVLIVALIVTVTGFFYELVYYFVSFMGNLEFKSIIFRVLIPECIYNGVLSVLVYALMIKPAKALWIDKGESVG